MSSSFDKFAILDSFLDEVGSYLPEIEANLDKLEKVPDDVEALEDAHRRAHTISGSASMMDFPGLSRVAHAMEDVLGDALDEVLKLDQPAISLLRRSLERVRLLLAAIKNGTNNEDKIVAEDATEHAGFRQAQEAQQASRGLVQEAIIVPSSAEEPLAPPVTFSALNDELSEWPLPQAFSSQTLAAGPQEATPSPAALPDWLTMLGAGSPAAPAPEEPPTQPTTQPSASGEPLGTTTRPLPSSTVPEPGATPSRPLDFPTFEWSATSSGAGSANGFQPTPQADAAWPSSLLNYQEGDTAPSLQAVPGGQEASQPSLEEMLEAFRSPADGEWPEQPAVSGAMPAASSSPFQMDPAPAPFTFVPLSSSIPPEFELKAPVSPASTPTPAAPASPAAPPPVSAAPPAAPAPRAAEPKAPRPMEPAAAPQAPALAAQSSVSAPLSVTRKENGQASPPLLAWQEVVEHESDLRRSAAALKTTLASLRGVVASIEQERSELRSFLDGSKDAIDRLELWAGRAMGLDLRQSPDHVRRYLPLSVLWVVTTHLKKLLAGLKEATNGLSATEGEMSVTSAQLAEAIRNCGTFVSSMLTMAPQEPGAGFSATLAHFSWTAPAQAAPQAVESTASAAAPAAPQQETAAPAIDEAALREQVRQELERQVRQEVERKVRAELELEVRREESERIRQELELELRRQMLDQLAAQTYAAPARPSPSTASRPLMAFPPEPKRKKVVRATEQSEEALEVFRAEAEEHLQNIGMGVTALEHAPEDREVLQGIRRSTHTLKGAAAMMGFAHIADLSHISEDLLDQIMEDKVQVNKDVLSVILDTSEALELLVLGKTGERGGDEVVVESLRKRYQALLAQPDEAEGEHTAQAQSAAVDVVEEAANEMLRESLQSEQQSGHALSVETSGAAIDKNELSVRIKLKKLDELVNLFGEQLVNRSILDEKLNRLLRMVADVGISSTRLRDVGGQLETRYEAAMLPSGRISAQANSQESVTPVTSTTRPLGRKALPPGRQVSLPLSASAIGGLSDINGQSTDFDELELDRYNEFHRLARGLSEGISDMTTLSAEMEATIRECEQVFQREMRLSSTFQDQLLKVRLVPLSTMVPRLYRAARAVALRLGKEIDLVMEGEETEVDRTVYEEVAGPLLHLVRNAVTHGIETPEAREAAGKPRAGTIKLSATYEGNQVIITVREDGAGIDAERVRSTAIARGLLDARSPLSEQSVLNLIFRPGFSTAESVSEESGRGVGLDVVHDVVSRMRGTIEVESTPGEGTAWTMKFPISLQIQRAVLVRAANQTYAIPMALVEQITRLDYHPGTRALGVPGIEVRGEAYALTDLASLLSLPPARPDDRASVLLIVSGRQRFALTVEGVVGKQEIVAKNLGPHLRQVKGVAGATVLGNGQVVLILEILELLEQLKTQSAALSVVAPVLAHGAAAGTAPAPSRLAPPTWSSAVPISNRGQLPAAPLRPEEQYVLVVDDSPSVRRVVSNMLKTAGWEVQTARDGMEAMEVAAKRSPAAVLLDIEMPRMDGYELMATLRSQDQFKHLPLIVLTSRAAAKHHQRAFQLGADAYLVKPYQDEELLKTLNTLVRGARA